MSSEEKGGAGADLEALRLLADLILAQEEGIADGSLVAVGGYVYPAAQAGGPRTGLPPKVTARLLDHEGNWTPPFPVASLVTCRAADGWWDHKLFGAVRPGDNPFQAMTFCGKRALEVPGHGGLVNCPKCTQYMDGDEED